MARPAPSHWRLYKDSQRDHVFSPSAAATFACAVLVLAIGLRSTSGFAWFVHESGHTDAPIFYAIAHDADWGVTRLEPQHIAPGLAAFGLVAVNVLAELVVETPWCFARVGLALPVQPRFSDRPLF